MSFCSDFAFGDLPEVNLFLSTFPLANHQDISCVLNQNHNKGLPFTIIRSYIFMDKSRMLRSASCFPQLLKEKHMKSSVTLEFGSLCVCLCMCVFWHTQKDTFCSVVSDFATPWTVACQVSLSMWFPGKNTGWVAISFSRGSSWPRDRTWVSLIAGRFFTIWATREALRDPEWRKNWHSFNNVQLIP